MADGRIYITISDQPSGKGRGKGTGAGKKEESEKSSTLFNQTMHFVRQEANQTLNYVVGNIGNFTGDYTAQRNSQRLLGAGKKALNIGIAFATNPVVGAFTLATSVIGFAEREYAEYFAIKKQNYSISQIRSISGLDTLNNGSR